MKDASWRQIEKRAGTLLIELEEKLKLLEYMKDQNPIWHSILSNLTACRNNIYALDKNGGSGKNRNWRNFTKRYYNEKLKKCRDVLTETEIHIKKSPGMIKASAFGI